MLLLDQPVSKQDWRPVAARNGALPTGAARSPREPLEDAGPWAPAIQKIIGFQNLEDDWDGFGAEAPSQEVLASAIGLAYCFHEKRIDPPHCVVAGVGGEIVFVWQHPDGTYAEIEIDGLLHAEGMCVEPGKPARHW